MQLGDIAILELGLEEMSEEIEDLEHNPDYAGTGDATITKPRTPEEERQMEIQAYERAREFERRNMTNDERLASMGITITKES